MSAKTDFLEDEIIDHVLRNAAYTGPVTVYLALLTADPTDAGTQTNEVSGGSYARQSVAFDAPSPAGETQNTSLIAFPTATAAWGTVSHWAIADASTSGNYLYHGAFDAAKAVASGDDVEIAAGELEINET
jgi:hypothetical protein